MNKTYKTIIRLPNSSDVLGMYIAQALSHTESTFFTQESASLQVGVHNWPTQHLVTTHQHVRVQNSVPAYQILLVVQGKIAVTFFDYSNQPVQTILATANDMVFIFSSLHSVRSLIANTKVLEIKQGPVAAFKKSNARISK
jgi:hypothetical protein